MKKLCHSLRKSLLFFFLFVITLSACKFDLINNENEDEVLKALSTAVHFYSCEEGGDSTPEVITKKFRMGILHNSSDLLSGSERARLSGGGNFLGYKFYRLTDGGSTTRPVYVHVNSDGYITSTYVSDYEMDFVTVWGISYRVKHFLQNTDGTSYPTTPFRTETLSAIAGENSNAQALTGSDIAGFTYDSSSSDNLVQPVAADGSTVINLKYARNSITLTFNTVYNPDGSSSTTPVTRTGLYGAAVASVENPTCEGKTFSFWKDSGNNEVTVPATFPSENQTFTAVWDAITYTFTFNLNGGYIGGSNASIIQKQIIIVIMQVL